MNISKIAERVIAKGRIAARPMERTMKMVQGGPDMHLRCEISWKPGIHSVNDAVTYGQQLKAAYAKDKQVIEKYAIVDNPSGQMVWLDYSDGWMKLSMTFSVEIKEADLLTGQFLPAVKNLGYDTKPIEDKIS